MEALVATVLALLVYMLPSLIAFQRGHASKLAITLCNVFFGLTGIGWVVCLIWSLGNKGASQTVIVNNHVGDRNVSND